MAAGKQTPKHPTGHSHPSRKAGRKKKNSETLAAGTTIMDECMVKYKSERWERKRSRGVLTLGERRNWRLSGGELKADMRRPW